MLFAITRATLISAVLGISGTLARTWRRIKRHRRRNEHHRSVDSYARRWRRPQLTDHCHVNEYNRKEQKRRGAGWSTSRVHAHLINAHLPSRRRDFSHVSSTIRIISQVLIARSTCPVRDVRAIYVNFSDAIERVRRVASPQHRRDVGTKV